MKAEQDLNPVLLAGVSRSFYLSMRVLPLELREPVALAYLLARAADTLVDTAQLSQEQRRQYLFDFKDYLDRPEAAGQCDAISSGVQGNPDNPAETKLLQSLPSLFALLARQAENDRQLIRQVLMTLTDGMLFDLDTFPGEASGERVGLQHEGELDHYMYLVAGCVGRFWTDISITHIAALSAWDQQRMSDLGIDFGKALQLINILRDVPRDLRIGRCYLPQTWLAQQQLGLEDLLDTENSQRAQALLQQGIALALTHFKAGEEYVLAIPRRCLRLRLAALWPLLIGLATLRKLVLSQHWLDVDTTVKVERKWIYAMMLKSILCVPSNVALRHWFARARRELGHVSQ